MHPQPPNLLASLEPQRPESKPVRPEIPRPLLPAPAYDGLPDAQGFLPGDNLSALETLVPASCNLRGERESPERVECDKPV